MISIFKMRLLHWKKQVLTLLFWLLFPIIATLGIIYMTSTVQEESDIPVGIVMEEDSSLANDLVESIDQTPFIRILQTTETNALQSLETHELDSVFIIQDGYQDQVEAGSRNRLVTSYRSDMSLAYMPVSEMIISYVQQDTGRSKAAYTVLDLNEAYNYNEQWTWEEIVAKSKEIEAEENLLQTAFSFQGPATAATDENMMLFDTWGLWAIFSVLATLLLFDWLIKEQKETLYPRFIFFRIPFKIYLVLNAVIYTLLFLVFDFIAAFIFNLYLAEEISLSSIFILVTYRLMINAGVFVFTVLFRNSSLFYTVSFALSLLIAIMSGAILPIEGITNRLPWLAFFNPLGAFLSGEMSITWMFIFFLLIGIWLARKEKANA